MHPKHQGSRTKGTYRKTLGIYSLGIILLEIAYWKSIEEIIDVDPGKMAATSELHKIQRELAESRIEIISGHVHANLGDNYSHCCRELC